jgi:adenine-specific DNA-methyltransferase
MANLSQMRRKKMLEFLETLKEQHSDDEALIAINQIEKELTSKKYGLVWEEHEEDVDVKMQTQIPVFTEQDDKELAENKYAEDYNFILEGDNLHSLKLLEKTHKNKIDAIFIDPPYNTGEKDFIYDDCYVDEQDSFRHSKWLSFMFERLTIARTLLKDTGFIFICIDDKEASQLKLLCDEIFGEENYEKTDYIQVRYHEKTLKSDMKYHKEIEQVLVYRKSVLAQPYQKPMEYEYDKFVFTIEELSPGREIELGGKKVIIYEKNQYKIVRHPEGFKEGLKEIWATGTILNGNSSGRFFRDYLDGRKEIDGLGILYKVYGIGDDQYDYRYFTGPQRETATKGKYYQGVPIEKMKEGSMKVAPIPNFYDMSGDFGNIRHEGGVGFNSGKKPVKMIKQYLQYFENKDITVLDFFAGSGSTGHAVLELNKEDGGRRKFILCTNNQNNICEEITYPRIQNVIKGYGSYKGIPSNLKYYKTDFVSKGSDDLYESLIVHTKEMIQLQYGVKVDNKKYVMIMDDEEVDIFEKDYLKYRDIQAVFINQDVLLSTSQEKLLSKFNVYIIPNYYFDSELREAGELW